MRYKCNNPNNKTAKIAQDINVTIQIKKTAKIAQDTNVIIQNKKTA